MQQNATILHNNYNNYDYSKDRGPTAPPIALNHDAYSLYEEATSEDITEIYTRNKLNELMHELFLESQWVDKYGGDNRNKVEKCDMSDIFYYFHNKLLEMYKCNEVDVFCTIAEFFDMNYKILYQDILTIETKIRVLNTLKETKGLSKEFGTRENRLF